MAELVGTAVRGYRDIAAMWVRASMAYRASFWMLAVSGFVISGLDFAGIAIMFTAVEDLGGFGIGEIALLYGTTGLGLAIADLFVGRIERLGQMVRTGRLDVMMVRPVPLLAQVCADEFALRRVSRVLQAGLILGFGSTYVDWSVGKVVVAAVMVASASGIFVAVFVGFACLQFWAADSTEVGSAFTYGGNTVTQYPLTIFPQELVKTLTFMVPLAFVNWYPCLYLLDRPDPFGMPTVLQFASPVVAALLLAVAGLTWRSGVRHYTSTGS